jgi:integral membrane protein (TIGR01906 family)
VHDWRASLASLLITLLIPFALIGLALRLLLTPAFLYIEYNLPYFPADEYGFTTQDRLRWAPAALDYLVNEAGIQYLGELRFEDGAPLFNERELSHMQDVKNVTRAALRAWYFDLVCLGLLSWWAWRSGNLPLLRGAARRGGWLMVGLAGAVGLVVLIGMLAAPGLFWDFFTLFHTMFFEGDSWLFEYSDTLIRLFPIRFWQDVFLFAAAIALGGGLLLAFQADARQRTPARPAPPTS